MTRTTPSILRHAAAVVASTAAAGWSAAVSAAPRPGASAGGHAAMGEACGLVPMGGRGMDRRLDAVDANPGQPTRIQAIAQAARTDLASARDGDMALREQALALWAEPGIDADAAEALRQKMPARVHSRSARMTQAMLEVGQVMTPAQRRRWAQALQAGRDDRPRHARAHRDAASAVR
jgi:Spy/CpxP family protein refolding chaperone